MPSAMIPSYRQRPTDFPEKAYATQQRPACPGELDSRRLPFRARSALAVAPHSCIIRKHPAKIVTSLGANAMRRLLLVLLVQVCLAAPLTAGEFQFKDG